MTDIAYNCLNTHKQAVDFLSLWGEVNNELKFDEAVARRKKSQFYSELMLDPRFVSFENNVWDLKSRYTFNETFVDTSSIGEDDAYDEETDNELEEEEEEEENKSSSEEDY